MIFTFIFNLINNYYDILNYIHFYKIKKNNKILNQSNIDYNNIIYNDILYKIRVKVNIYNLKIFNNYIGLHYYKKKSYNDNQLSLNNNYINKNTLIKFIDSRIILIPNYTYIQNEFKNNKNYCITKKFIVTDIDDYFVYVKFNNDIIDKIQIYILILLYISIYFFCFCLVIIKIKNFFQI